MPELSRREFITAVAVAGVVSGLDRVVAAQSEATKTISPVSLKWLDRVSLSSAIVTGTVPWPRGELAPGTSLHVSTPDGEIVPSQTSQLAFWPDGTVKWTAHSIAAGKASPAPSPPAQYLIAPGEPGQPQQPIKTTESPKAINIDTGVIVCSIPRKGSLLIDKIVRGGRTTLSRGQLVVHCQDQPEGGSLQSFTSELTTAAIESPGVLCTVIKIDGIHRSESGRSLLPFNVRLYFHAGSDEIRIIHAFIYDADEQKDFIRGIGVRFDVPMTDAPHDRHVRFIGEGSGLFAEAIRGITGLRRDPGTVARKAQIDGVATGPVNQWESIVAGHLQVIPQWGDYTLTQLCADGFQIRKRTRGGYGWIAAAAGRRSGGVGYIGGISGGVAFGIRDFWQKHPAQIDIRNAHTSLSQVTLWLWAPDAQAMDLRFYHDGMGEDTYPKQNEGLDTTYEDYEPGYGSPYGIARSSEMYLKVCPETPSRSELVDFADSVGKPPVLVCEPQRYLDADVFGGIWTLPDRSTPAKSLIEDELAFYLDQYLKEVSQRSWYGFWDYGDVRHAYDADRHVWRYDVGGFAWDNSELSTDLWLWYSFLRTGRADIFRLAEAMTRHTGEVDVYHIGPRKGLGTRHGVQHWGDSSKQTRISSALYRRPYYFLTGDARVGDLMRDQLTESDTWLTNDVERKLGGPPRIKATRQTAPCGFMAWGETASAWLTEIERTQDKKIQEKIINSLKSISALKHGFFSDGATMDLDTGIITCKSEEIVIEHLTACFGLPEICAELSRTYGSEAPGFAGAWAQYGELYNASNAEKDKALGSHGKKVSMADAHSRCLAFAAWHHKDPALAQRVWHDWLDGKSTSRRKADLVTKHLEGPIVLTPVDEANVSTNNAAQFSLSTIQNLALAPGSVETTLTL